jgi:hypothetical protein
MAKDGIIWLVKQYHGYTIHKNMAKSLGMVYPILLYPTLYHSH